MLRVLSEEKVETEYPVGVINWTKYRSLNLDECNPCVL